MNETLIQMVELEETRGIVKWGRVDKTPGDLLNAALEELGEAAHAVNHNEGAEKASQEIAETIGVLSRLYNMLWAPTKVVHLRSPRVERVGDCSACVPDPVKCTPENPCCDRRGEYNGFASGPLIFECPKHCSCHD